MFPRIIIAFSLLSIIVFGNFCRHQIPEHLADYERITLSSKETKSDIQFAADMLKNGYAGSRFQNSKIMDTVIANLNNVAASAGSTNVKNLCFEIAKATSILLDSHFSVGLPSPRGMMPCQQDSSDGWVSVGKNLQNNRDLNWQLIKVKTSKGHEADVLAISRFRFTGKEHWEKFVETADYLSTRPYFIVDLRGNSGGSDRYLMEWIAKLLKGDRDIQFGGWAFKSPQAFQVLLNWVKRAREKATTDDAREYFKSAISDFQRDLSKARHGELARWERLTPDPIKGSAKEDYSGIIYILTDRGIASTAEEMVALLDKNFKARKIGTNTGGVLQFGEIGNAILPKSGIYIDIGTTFYENPYGFIETIGIPPDIRLNEGQDALETALKEIDKSF
jgi:hypothetical protein